MGLMEDIAASIVRLENKVDALSAEEPITQHHADSETCWLDPRSAAEYVGMSHQSLALYRSKGEGGPAFSKVGSTIRYDRQDLDKWLGAHKRCF